MLHRIVIDQGRPVESTLKKWVTEKNITLPCYIQLNGTLAQVDVSPSPESPPLSVHGPLYIATGQTVIDEHRTQTMGVVSWSDNGVPRMLAGRLTNLVAERIVGVIVLDGQSLRPVTFAPSHAPEAIRTEAHSEGPDTLVPEDVLQPARSALKSTMEMPQLGDLKGTIDSGWAQALSESQESNASNTLEPELKPGDVLLHPRFGRCRVVRTPMFGKVKARRPTGALIDLHLKVLLLKRLPDEDGRRIFEVSIRKR